MPKISVSVLLMCMLSVRSNLLFERHYEIMTNLISNNRKYTCEMKIVKCITIMHPLCMREWLEYIPPQTVSMDGTIIQKRGSAFGD